MPCPFSELVPPRTPAGSSSSGPVTPQLQYSPSRDTRNNELLPCYGISALNATACCEVDHDTCGQLVTQRSQQLVSTSQHQSDTDAAATLHRAISAVDVRDAAESSSSRGAPSPGHAQPRSHAPGSDTSSRPLAPWQVKRPVLKGCPKLKRRELRRLNRTWTLQEVAQHHYIDDIWITVDGKVYDITEHLVNHEAWETAGVTTPLSILAHAGMECTHEFHAIHRVYPIAYRQLAAYFIGDLNLAGADQMPSVA